MSEVSGPIVAITLVLASVFVPLAFLGGVTGQFYKQFAVTIAAAVIISGFNSLTLSPALAAMLLQPHGAKKDALGRWIERIFGRLFAAFNRVFKRFGDRYSGGIGGTIAPRPAAARNLRRADRRGRFRLPRRAGRLHPVAGQAIPVRDRAAPGSRDDRPHRRRHAAHGRHRHAGAGRRERRAVPGPERRALRRHPERRASCSSASSSRASANSEAGEIAMRINMGFGQIQEGLAFALLPPPVLGLGNANGLELYVEDRGDLGYGELYNQTMACIGAVNSTPGFDPMATFTSYQSNVPQLDAERRPHQGQGARPRADATSSTRCRSTSAPPTSTTSTCSGAPTRCTRRRTRRTARASRTSRA